MFTVQTHLKNMTLAVVTLLNLAMPATKMAARELAATRNTPVHCVHCSGRFAKLGRARSPCKRSGRRVLAVRQALVTCVWPLEGLPYFNIVSFTAGINGRQLLPQFQDLQHH